jgi:cell shape-determining protein MreC
MSDVTEKELNDFDDCIREVDEIEEQRKTNRNLLGKLEHLKQELKDTKEDRDLWKHSERTCNTMFNEQLDELEQLKQERDDLKEENTRYRLYIELINRHTETALKEKQ